jgi:hypothetical protein
MNVKSVTPPAAPATGRVNLFELERTTLRELVNLVESRNAAETAAKAAHTGTISTAEKDLARSRRLNTTGRERDLTALNEAHQAALRQIAEQFKAEMDAAEAEFNEAAGDRGVRRGREQIPHHLSGHALDGRLGLRGGRKAVGRRAGGHSAQGGRDG